MQSVIVPTTVVQNIINCVETAGVSVSGLVIKPLASSLGALTEEETRAGVISLCIGGGTTGGCSFCRRSPCKIGYDTNWWRSYNDDLAYVMKIPISKAEENKETYFSR